MKKVVLCVVGLIRVRGSFNERILVPSGYRSGDDITKDPQLVKLCDLYFPHLKGKMRVGGDTGGFGLP